MVKLIRSWVQYLSSANSVDSTQEQLRALEARVGDLEVGRSNVSDTGSDSDLACLAFIENILDKQYFNYTWNDGKSEALITANSILAAGIFVVFQTSDNPSRTAGVLLSAAMVAVLTSLVLLLRHAVPRLNSGVSGPQDNLRAQTGIASHGSAEAYEAAVRMLTTTDRIHLACRQVYGMAANNIRSHGLIRAAAGLTMGAAILIAAGGVLLLTANDLPETLEPEESDPMPQTMQYINGEWSPGGGELHTLVNPATGEDLWQWRSASVGDVDRAANAAETAFSEWASFDLEHRQDFLKSFVDTVAERGEEIASSISDEIGKPLWEARTEVRAIVGKLEPTLESYAVRNATFRPSGSNAITRFVPHGPVAVIGPFNFPVHMPNVHIMPALLAGNTVVWKQTEAAPQSGSLVAECWESAGLPPGVLNLLHGGGNVGAELVENDLMRGVFFTGSGEVGRSISDATLNTGKIVALEMGGNTPLVVWDASSMPGAVHVAVQSCFVTAGQRCSSARRLIVRNGEFGDRFIDSFIATANELVVGHPKADPQPFMGPVVSKAAAAKCIEYQEALVERGAEVMLAARWSQHEGGSYVTPGVLDVSEIETIPDEEVLGPIVTIRRVDSFSEAMHEANRTRYGLAGALVSEDDALYAQFRREMETGIVSLNAATTGNSGRAAFGGIKDSGNFRPTGFYTVDYCSRAVGSTENSRAELPSSVAPGLEIIEA